MAKWIEGGDLDILRAISPERIVVLDTETTGLNKELDEMVQVSLIDGNGNVLFDTYLKPKNTTSWPQAEAVHGISPKMVENALGFEAYKEQVETIIRSADLLIGYNLSFDLGFVRAAGVTTRQSTIKFDVMKEYAPVHGIWFEWKNDWKWATLKECAGHYGLTFKAHNSLEDAKATLYCFHAMLEDKSPGGYLYLHGNNDALNVHNRYYVSESQQYASPQPSIEHASKDAQKEKGKVGKGFIALVVFAVLFIMAGLNSVAQGTSGGVSSLVVGIVLCIFAWAKRRNR